MKNLKKPAVTLIGAAFVLLTGSLFDWGLANGFAVILTAASSLFFALLLHEAGHLAGGLLTKSRLLKMTVGPFTIVRNGKDRLGFGFNGAWSETGGLVSMQIEDPSFREKVLLYNAGGPLASLAFSLLSFSDARVLELTGIISLFLFIVTILPYNLGGMFSDGYTLFRLLQKDEAFLRYYKMTNMLLSPKNPELWDLSVREEAAAAEPTKLSMTELSTHLMFLFYTAVLTGETEQLKRFYGKLNFEQLHSKNAVQKVIFLHYIAASEFLMGREFSFPLSVFDDFPEVDKLSALRTQSIFGKTDGSGPEAVTGYRRHLESQPAESYSFLQVEKKFLHKWLLS